MLGYQNEAGEAAHESRPNRACAQHDEERGQGAANERRGAREQSREGCECSCLETVH